MRQCRVRDGFTTRVVRKCPREAHAWDGGTSMTARDHRVERRRTRDAGIMRRVHDYCGFGAPSRDARLNSPVKPDQRR